MGALMGEDLDQLAEIITGALQEVGEEPGPGAATSTGETKGNQEPLAVTRLNQDQDLKSHKEQNLKEVLKIKQQGYLFSWRGWG